MSQFSRTLCLAALILGSGCQSPTSTSKRIAPTPHFEVPQQQEPWEREVLQRVSLARQYEAERTAAAAWKQELAALQLHVAPATERFPRVSVVPVVALTGREKRNPSALDPPANLEARFISTPGIVLCWTDASDDETGFEIQRSLSWDLEDWTTLAVIPTNEVRYEDNTVNILPGGTPFRYRIRAIRAGHTSPWSNVTGPLSA